MMPSQEARALTQRMPPTLVKNDPVILNSVSVLRSIWQNKYSETYEILRKRPWPEPVNIVVQRFDGENTWKSLALLNQLTDLV